MQSDQLEERPMICHILKSQFLLCPKCECMAYSTFSARTNRQTESRLYCKAFDMFPFFQSCFDKVLVLSFFPGLYTCFVRES